MWCTPIGVQMKFCAVVPVDGLQKYQVMGFGSIKFFVGKRHAQNSNRQEMACEESASYGMSHL